MEIPKPNRIMVWGTFVLDETNAPTKTIAKNIGIPYSKVSVNPPWMKVMTLLVAATASTNIGAHQCNSYSDSIIIAYSNYVIASASKYKHKQTKKLLF